MPGRFQRGEQKRMTSDPLQSIEITAPTLEEAIENGLTTLGLARNEVIIEIVEEGSRGVLGMGARSAVVRLTPLRAPTIRPAASTPVPPAEPPQHKLVPSAPPPAPQPPAHRERAHAAVEGLSEKPPVTDAEADDEVRVAKDVLAELLAQMKIRATIHAERAEPASPDEEPPWVLNIRGVDLGVLIGRRGETLSALQYITRLIVSREIQRRANIVIDVEGYKERREDALRKLARRMAEQVRKLGKTVTLEPMPPNERRIIHLTLRGDNTVTTESVGSGDDRKVTIIPSDAGH